VIGVVRAAVTEDAAGLGRSLRLKGWARWRGSVFQTNLSDKLVGEPADPRWVCQLSLLHSLRKKAHMITEAGGTGQVDNSLTQAVVGEGRQVRSQCVHEASVAALRDGGTVVLRRLDAADIDAVIALHDALSDHERYLRFFTKRPAYLKTLARELTERSDKDYALGAFESGELIGVANYVACHSPATAEVAMVVAHNDHLRGVGTALLGRLSHIARSNAIQHLVADVLVENQLMRRVLRDTGWRHVASNDGHVLHVDIDLPAVT
jgi:RimJ/RimL family protein N-acetyltransferase